MLFFDEFDALGASRGGHDSQFWSTFVNTLLQEMDGLKGRNTDVLVFAATNMPWKVDAAFRRPGRFDRVLLVTPPDVEARHAILASRLAKIPGGEGLRVDKLAKGTELYSGADLVGLCDRAAEEALERSLEGGGIQPISAKDLDRALRDSQPTTLEWMSTARNYAKYANDGQFDELAAFLKKVKRW